MLTLKMPLKGFQFLNFGVSHKEVGILYSVKNRASIMTNEDNGYELEKGEAKSRKWMSLSEFDLKPQAFVRSSLLLQTQHFCTSTEQYQGEIRR